jgi:hypothetical protein
MVGSPPPTSLEEIGQIRDEDRPDELDQQQEYQEREVQSADGWDDPAGAARAPGSVSAESA